MLKKMSLVCLAFLVFFTFRISAEENVQILTAISIEGNEKISEEEILSYITNRPGEIFDGEKIKDDMERIYESGYFLDAAVYFEYYSGGLKAVFEVVEYPLLMDIIIQGNSIYSTEELIFLVELEKGIKKFNLSVYQEYN